MDKQSKGGERPRGIYIKPEFDRLVRALASARNSSNSGIVNVALSEYFTNHSDEIENDLHIFRDETDSILNEIQARRGKEK